MINLLAAVIALSLVTFFGIQIVLLFKNRAHWLELLALGYLIGIGVFTFVNFLVNWAGIYYSFKSTVVTLLGLIILFFHLHVFKRKFGFTSQQFFSLKSLRFYLKKTFLRKEKLLIGIIFVFLLSVLFTASFWPVRDWDSIVLYDFRARILIETGFFDPGVKSSYVFGYPLLTSYAHAWLYLFHYNYPGLIHGLYYVALVLSFYHCLRHYSNRWFTLLWTLAFAATPPLLEHAHLTYTNLAYTTYLATGYWYFLQWVEKKQAANLIISAILLGLSTWTRNAEPFWVVPILFLAVLAFKDKKLSLWIIYFGIIKIFNQLWKVFKLQYQASITTSSSTSESVSAQSDFLVKIWWTFIQPWWSMVMRLIRVHNLFTFPLVIDYLIKNAVMPYWTYFSIFLIAAIVLLQTPLKKITTYDGIYFMMILLNMVMIIIGSYHMQISFIDFTNIGGSATRMVLYLIPLFIFFAAKISAAYFGLSEKLKS